MPAPFYRQTLASSITSGALFNTYTTAKSVLNVDDVFPMPANYIRQFNKFKIRVWGGLSNIVTTPGTVTFQSVWNGVAAWSSGALQLATTANTLTPFVVDTIIRVATVGSGTSATLIGGGFAGSLAIQLGAGVADPTVTDSFLMVPAGSPAAGTGFASNAAFNVDFFVGFSISAAGNGVQIYDYTFDQIY